MAQNISTTDQDRSLGQMILYGLLLELVLILVQFIYVELFVATSPAEEVAFTEQYMRQTGFIIFQVIGFFVYVLATYLLLQRLLHNKIGKIIVFLVAGALLELVFYLFMQASYSGAFLYSILDKLVAAAFGALIYYFKDRGHKAKAN